MRKQGWEKILNQYIEDQKDKPFIWGENDCVLYAAHGANAILVCDLSDQIASYGQYDEATAKEIMEVKGGLKGLFDLHFKRLKFPKTAKRGDIAVVSFNDSLATGLVDGTGRFVACKTMDGLHRIPVSNIVYAWEVN